MFSITAILASIIISFSGLGSLFAFNFATVSYPLASIFHFAGNVPSLGVEDGSLNNCPPSPNCVVSQNSEEDQEHYIEPLSYEGDRQQAYDNFLKILSVVPNTTVVEQTANYIRTQSTSKLMGFVDDAEFYFPEEQNVVHWRSASRLGESDLGVNRRRLEQIRLAFQDFTK